VEASAADLAPEAANQWARRFPTAKPTMLVGPSI